MAKLRDMSWAEARLAGFDSWLNLLPTAMFFLLPLFAALLRLCYLGSGRYFVEHLVFAVHLHAFIYLVLLVQSLVWTRAAILGGLALVVMYLLVGCARLLATRGPAPCCAVCPSSPCTPLCTPSLCWRRCSGRSGCRCC